MLAGALGSRLRLLQEGAGGSGCRALLLRDLLTAGDGILLGPAFGFGRRLQTSSLQNLQARQKPAGYLVAGTTPPACLRSFVCAVEQKQTHYLLPLHPPVLVPGLHLQLTQTQRFRQIYSVVNIQRRHVSGVVGGREASLLRGLPPGVGVFWGHSPVGGGQVLLLLEALLQAHQLQLGEDGAAAPALLALDSALVSVL